MTYPASSPIYLPPRPTRDPDEITFIGTATTVIKIAGFTILTDPNFHHRGDRAYLGLGLSTRRRTEPALAPQQADFQEAVARAGLPTRIHYLNRGETGRLDTSPA